MDVIKNILAQRQDDILTATIKANIQAEDDLYELLAGYLKECGYNPECGSTLRCRVGGTTFVVNINIDDPSELFLILEEKQCRCGGVCSSCRSVDDDEEPPSIYLPVARVRTVEEVVQKMEKYAE